MEDTVEFTAPRLVTSESDNDGRAANSTNAVTDISLGGLLGLDLVGDEWQRRSLCTQTDPEAFFPEKGGSTRDAKRICMRCPVIDRCLEYALEHDERFGVWGGLSEGERRGLKRDRGASAEQDVNDDFDDFDDDFDDLEDLEGTGDVRKVG